MLFFQRQMDIYGLRNISENFWVPDPTLGAGPQYDPHKIGGIFEFFRLILMTQDPL